MGKATRNRARSARERIAEQQAAAKRAERRRQLLIIGGSIGLVVVVIVAFVIIKLAAGPAKQSRGGALPASVTKKITSVPAGTLAAVGAGSVASSPAPLTAVSGPPLVSGGKPEMLYIGAEYCPYCAAMRWAMAIALGRFGTFGPLNGIHSSSADVFPNTPTLTFHQATYTSPYLTFTHIEHIGLVNNNVVLEPVTTAQQQLWTKYDTPSAGYPFIDFGNKIVLKGPIYDPGVLKGLTWPQVAAQLSDPRSAVAQGADGAANYLTAAICKMTGNKPANVCLVAPIPTLEAKI